MSEMLGKITFFLLIWNFKNVKVSSRIKGKKRVCLIKVIFFQSFDMGRVRGGHVFSLKITKYGVFGV
jgi:hypothetical protein